MSDPAQSQRRDGMAGLIRLAVLCCSVGFSLPALAEGGGSAAPPREKSRPASVNNRSTANGIRWIAGAEYRVTSETRLTLSLLHLGDISASGGLATLDHHIGSNWGLQAGYIFVFRPGGDGPDLHDHFLRAGLTYRKDLGRFTFDDRLLYEVVASDRGRRDGDRLRNRARLSYRAAPFGALAPRLFASVEPVFDVRAGRLVRIDYAAGAGAIVEERWNAEISWLRQELSGPGQGERNALLIQLLYRMPLPRA